MLPAAPPSGKSAEVKQPCLKLEPTAHLHVCSQTHNSLKYSNSQRSCEVLMCLPYCDIVMYVLGLSGTETDI